MKTDRQRTDSNGSILPRRKFLQRAGLGIAGAALSSSLNPGSLFAASDSKPSRELIGFTEFRTNLPGGRHANGITMRAGVVRADGTRHRLLASELTRKPNTWTQFAGWSPDGRQAIIGGGWESPENAAWEEEHKTFRFARKGWLYDTLLLDRASGKLTNVTAVERVSFYNTGVFFWPKDPNKLGFQALIGGDSHPFSMDLDGRNKKDLTENSKEFAYGFNASPDGKQIAYHKSYQIYIADADGANARRIDTGQPFNFAPQWSPDGEWLLLVAGEHYNCHPNIVRRDGSGLRKVADRQGYRGVVEFLDVPDFHGGSSDVPIWSPDGKWIYYTAKIGECVELMRVSLVGKIEQLTQTQYDHLNYHPKFSPDGKWMVFGSNRSGTRQLYVMSADGGDAWPITQVKPGWGVMWAYWQPGSTSREKANQKNRSLFEKSSKHCSRRREEADRLQRAFHPPPHVAATKGMKFSGFKLMPRLRFLLGWVVLASTGLIFIAPANGQTSTNQFAFRDFFLSPVRVHLLSAKDSPAIQTTLTEKDITRILRKVNDVWSQAGLHFYLESLVREEAQGQEIYTKAAEQAGRLALLELCPMESRDTNLFHIYYLKEMPMNGIYFPAAIFVKDTASLRKVEGGIDEPLPRVTSHELGHALSLPHRQHTTNLMASGTTGTRLNEAEISQAREAARKFDWIQTAPDLMEKADALFRAGKLTKAATLYSRLATIPLGFDQVELAKKRIAPATRINSNSTTK